MQIRLWKQKVIEKLLLTYSFFFQNFAYVVKSPPSNFETPSIFRKIICIVILRENRTRTTSITEFIFREGNEMWTCKNLFGAHDTSDPGVHFMRHYYFYQSSTGAADLWDSQVGPMPHLITVTSCTTTLSLTTHMQTCSAPTSTSVSYFASLQATKAALLTSSFLLLVAVK